MPEVKWDIRREGRAWTGEECLVRFELGPEKFEVIDGKLLWSDEELMSLLAMLLEQAGVDRAVRLGDPAVWREAIASLNPANES
jgi:hypothetical protein